MLICGASHTVLNFRSSLISALIENNCEVAVVALDSEKKTKSKNSVLRFSFAAKTKTGTSRPLNF